MRISKCSWQGSLKAVDLYDLTLTYLETLNETLAEGLDYRNGEIIKEKVKNRVVQGTYNVQLSDFILLYHISDDYFITLLQVNFYNSRIVSMRYATSCISWNTLHDLLSIPYKQYRSHMQLPQFTGNVCLGDTFWR